MLDLLLRCLGRASVSVILRVLLRVGSFLRPKHSLAFLGSREVLLMVVHSHEFVEQVVEVLAVISVRSHDSTLVVELRLKD